MARGYFSLILHAHLPFVRHPEAETVFEENWFFEAVAESYLPLLLVFEKLAAEEVPFRVTISISPTLAAMLGDGLLRRRCAGYLRQKAAASAVAAKTNPAAKFLADHYAAMLREYEARDGNLAVAFRKLAELGKIELMTTAATHGFFPLLRQHPGAIPAQIETGVASHAEIFGARPAGFWLPECGYFPGIEPLLAKAGCAYSVVDSHAFLTASAPLPHGCFAPVNSSGVTLLARDPDSAREVWGAGGFPAHADYRDFHAVDADGFKTLRVTGPGPEKSPYDPAKAAARVARDARQFVESRVAQIAYQTERMGRAPVVVAPYDAELFGHWWFEGPQFIEHVIRRCAAHDGDIALATPSDFLDVYPPVFDATPGASSWGQHGFNEFWLNDANAWIQPHLRQAAKRFAAALAGSREGPAARALRQAGRSLLLAQASDWPFLITRGTSSAYAEKRIRDELARVHYLCDAVEHGAVDERRLKALEKMDSIFPGLDLAVFDAGNAR